MQVKIYESCRAAFDNGALACIALECTFVCPKERLKSEENRRRRQH